jgi:signal transduction histidine kinase
LAAALDQSVLEWQNLNDIPVDLMVHLGDQRLSEEVETSLYRIVQESLTNVARHANADNVSILIERRSDEVVAIIEDDGCGFEVEGDVENKGLGLLGIRERAQLLGGRFVIESSEGKGTNLYTIIPVTAIDSIERN